MEKNDFELIIPLWERAKEIEKKLPNIKKEVFKEIKEENPELIFKNFGNLKNAYKKNQLSNEISKKISARVERVIQMEEEAKIARVESRRLSELKRTLDTRKILNPSIDSIPEGKFPKIKDCQNFPLRKDCNYGENEDSKWDRCIFMTYHEEQSIFSSKRWICTAP